MSIIYLSQVNLDVILSLFLLLSFYTLYLLENYTRRTRTHVVD